MSPTEQRFALLIDADNICDQYVRTILNELASKGTVLCKRIYGDWTSTQHSKWKNVLLRHAIQPIQQYSYTSGKNATDSAMIIDAMDLLYSGNFDGFCLASSDSDFTRLAVRLREGGMYVIGMGEQKTPKSFCVACNEFKYLDLLKHQTPPTEPSVPPSSATNPGSSASKPKQPSTPKLEQPKSPTAKPVSPEEAPQKQLSSGSQPQPSNTHPTPAVANAEASAPNRPPQSLKAIRGIIHAILNENSDEEGWLALPRLKELLIKRQPSFDTRNFGKAKFSAFLETLGTLELRQSSAGHVAATRRKPSA